MAPVFHLAPGATTTLRSVASTLLVIALVLILIGIVAEGLHALFVVGVVCGIVGLALLVIDRRSV